MSLAPTPRLNLESLKARASMLAKARAFFYERGVLEIDCPILGSATNIDDHIDPIEVTFQNDKKGYLHTSPELFLKKLLALGEGQDLYFLGHVFRDHERGELHHTEFTMVEWYRHSLNFYEMIEETLDFIRLFVDGKVTQKSYYDLLLQETQIDYTQATREELLSYIKSHLDADLTFEKESKSDLLTFIFTECVEPSLAQEELVVVTEYPKEQAALAKTTSQGGREVALRFEIYYRGIELANGYDELRGSSELLERYEGLNKKRVSLGKNALSVDTLFVRANDSLPDCRGVALGFDRLMMLKLQHQSIHPSMCLIEA